MEGFSFLCNFYLYGLSPESMNCPVGTDWSLVSSLSWWGHVLLWNSVFTCLKIPKVNRESHLDGMCWAQGRYLFVCSNNIPKCFHTEWARLVKMNFIILPPLDRGLVCRLERVKHPRSPCPSPWCWRLNHGFKAAFRRGEFPERCYSYTHLGRARWTDGCAVQTQIIGNLNRGFSPRGPVSCPGSRRRPLSSAPNFFFFFFGMRDPFIPPWKNQREVVPTQRFNIICVHCCCVNLLKLSTEFKALGIFL